ncbi:hypothetical protein Lepto7376_1361 [[Leptolyngbya] sp. PCC 7376]|uniref:hypothetical protein n=1 Tax=[Leptolyngbya] sp. PCC 7376 TaxID=111781 RepID=UPI00029F13FF|nr:hypothetical protein [[Leptolyngbya] sp. PCC 7376]AFY37713.1 hypothetical protein Lepto7376_1361 [[Leptolyngbya] sp. PCC 7376]
MKLLSFQKSLPVLTQAVIATTVGAFSIFNATPAMAGNAVFNEDLATVETAFGRYYTRLTTLDDGTNTQRIYTFNTTGLRAAIPTLPAGTKFSILFVNEKAQDVFLDLPDSDANKFRYDQDVASSFFRYVLGWTPPTWFELDFSLFGAYIESTYEYCLGDGVATSWQTVEPSGQYFYSELPKLYYDTQCAPPYEQ